MKKRFLVSCFLLIAFLVLAAVTFKLTSPLVRSEFIFIPNAPKTAVAHAASIAETSSGFIAAWYGRNNGGQEKIFVSRLERGSRVWTPPAMVAEGAGGKDAAGYWNPVLFQQNNGPLFLFYKTDENPQGWEGMFKVSLDSGKTWGPAERLPDGILGPIKNKPVELDDGTVLCPSSTESPDGWNIYIERIRPKNTGDFLLKNKWSKIGPLNNRSLRVIQPALLNFGEGRMLLLSRNKKLDLSLSRPIMEARSTDNGLTWSALKPTGLPNPNSGIDAATLKDGRCILVYNPSSIMRTPLDVAVSTDEGKTWALCLRLENGFGEYSYPSVIQASDGMIHILYSWKKRKIRHVVLDPQLIRIK
jgi:predicted neuraminidase